MGCCLGANHLAIPSPPHSFPDYVSSPVEELHREFLTSVYLFLMNQGVFFQKRRDDPPIRFKQPEELHSIIDYELKSRGTDQFKLLDVLAHIIHYSPTFAHPYYMFQLLAGLDPYAIIGDFIAAFLPSTMLHYRSGPVYALMEEEVSKKLRHLAGYPEGTGDCIFPPGAAIANIFAMLLARHYKFPETKKKGMMHLPRLAIFVSQDSHSCYNKGAIFTGIGLNNVYPVITDDRGRMSIPHLEKCVEDAVRARQIPFLVGATSGSNVYGVYDPLDKLSRVCKRYGMWLHADGALGGGLIFSPTQRATRLKGIELCDSFSGNFHKVGSATQVSSYLLTPHSHLMSEVFGILTTGDFTSFSGDYDIDHFHSERDVFHKYVDHVRRPDIVKLFIMLKGKGLQGMAANIDDAYERAGFFMRELKRRQKESGKFVPLMEEIESPVIPFFYIPHYLQKRDKISPDYKEQLNLHTSFMLAELINNGIMVLTVQNLRQSPLFFKIVLHNSAVTNKDLIYMLDQLENYGMNVRVPMI